MAHLSVPTQQASRVTPVQAGLARPQVLAVWGVWLLSVVLVVVGVATGVASATDVYSAITGLTGSVAAVSLATVGAILVTRLPRNAVGWLLWVAGVLLGLSFGLTG